MHVLRWFCYICYPDIPLRCARSSPDFCKVYASPLAGSSSRVPSNNQISINSTYRWNNVRAAQVNDLVFIEWPTLPRFSRGVSTGCILLLNTASRVRRGGRIPTGSAKVRSYTPVYWGFCKVSINKYAHFYKYASFLVIIILEIRSNPHISNPHIKNFTVYIWNS